jgi:hypothetical protein
MMKRRTIRQKKVKRMTMIDFMLVHCHVPVLLTAPFYMPYIGFYDPPLHVSVPSHSLYKSSLRVISRTINLTFYSHYFFVSGI